MFQLILTACLAVSSAVCAPILLPAGEAASLDACKATAARISQAWLAERPTLTGGASTCLPVSDLPSLPLQQIAPGVFVYEGSPVQMEDTGDGRIANLAVVIGERSVAVIDSGVSRAQGQEFYAAIRGLTDLPVSHLILTHMHPDHVFGASVFREAGAQILGHAALPQALELRAQTYLDNIARLYPPATVLGTETVLAETTVEDRLEIDLGRRRLTLAAAPVAHTDNDLTVFDHETGTLFAGDLLFRDLTPILDGSLSGWLQWGDVPPDPMPRLVVPGHGPVAANWTQAVTPQQAFLKALEEETRAQIRDGIPMSSAVSQIVNRLEKMAEYWNAFPESAARNATAAYKELEWE